MAKKGKKSVKKANKGNKMMAKKATTTKVVMKAPPKAPKARVSTKPKNTGTLSYTQTEFIENVRGFCGFHKRSEAKEICEDMAAFIKDSLKRGYKIPLLGIGKMYVRHSKARMGRNPATGEVIQIAAKKRVRFSAAKALKEAVL